MSLAETLLLGALAGGTIFLGLPFGRLPLVGPRTRVALAMFSVGVLAFLFVDVLEHGFGIVEHAVEAAKENDGSGARAIVLALLLGSGFAAGLAGVAMVERLKPRRSSRPPVAGGSTDVLAPADAERIAIETADARSRALRTAMTIAVAIGLHNFAEGLAIGVSAGAGDVSLATVLIVGFALHNATEGFGIVGPLGPVRPSWRWLLAAGLIGRRADLRGLAGRLERQLGGARARVLRRIGRRHPLRHR